MPDVVFKLVENWHITPLGGTKCANFLKIDSFKRPSLPHRMSQGHQIFNFATQERALEDHQGSARSLRNWERYCELNLENRKKIVKF